MKFLLVFFLSSAYLVALSFWTLTGVTKANIYIVNGISSLESSTTKQVREKMISMLHSVGIKTEQKDSPTLMLTLAEIENEDDHYVHIQLSLGEDVNTQRENKDPAFAITYQVSDFIESDTQELDGEVLESLDFLLSQFVEQFEDDKD